MIVYGKGCAGCQTIPRTEQPLPKKELPEGTNHGNAIAYNVYGCRCDECAAWKSRQGGRKRHYVRSW